MTLAVILTLLLAQATSSPSPLPSNFVNGATRSLTLDEALKRLIPDAVNEFAGDRGAKVVSPRGETGYALTFGIAGLTDCAIVATDFPFAMCIAYRGKDAAAARSAYYALKARLHGFAGRGVPIDEAVTAADTATLTTASYRPNASTEVMIEMVEAERNAAVVLAIKPIGTL
ncbi:MAG: hypothetical protein WAK84_10780 [Candidatus Cybelea sp.]